MYLSSVSLVNWRSYAEAQFDFEVPTPQRPLVLIGAMNGHGKTSLLYALYLGLFGRFGLRHTDGFDAFDQEDNSYYRSAIRNFRRNGAPSDEPTKVDVTLAPSIKDGTGGVEIRIVRSWFFNSSGEPKQREGFEEIQLYVDGVPQSRLSPDLAHERIERQLFSADFMPAFFFDGEQAQQLINNSGEAGLKKSVEVLYGTKVIEEALGLVKDYISRSRQQIGGKKKAGEQQTKLNEKVAEREVLEAKQAKAKQTLSELEQQRETLKESEHHLQEDLARLGGGRVHDVEAVHGEVEAARRAEDEAARAISESSRELGLSLAVSRMALPIQNRLQSELQREQWERLRDGTESRTQQVLSHALPEPASADSLLGHLNEGVRSAVKARFREAIELIYNPPPTNCANEYLLGHAKGEARERLLLALNRARMQRPEQLASAAKRWKDAREQVQDASDRRDRLGSLPEQLTKLHDALKEVGEQIAECSQRIGALDHEVEERKGELKRISALIGQLNELLAKLEPEQKRIAVAERMRRVLENLEQELRPVTLRRLEELVTEHFTAIADERFSDGEVKFPEGSPPRLRRPNHPDDLIEMMSGFERRSFGIAFSLALAKLIRRRLPLIIDTPLGNADTAYRSRLLEAITQVDLDQVIILTHDAEISGDLYQQIKDQVAQTFVVRYDPFRKESIVHVGEYFGEYSYESRV